MADTLDPKHLDKRTAEPYLRSGQLDEKAYERHLKSLLPCRPVSTEKILGLRMPFDYNEPAGITHYSGH